MIPALLAYFSEEFSVLSVSRYITFRAGVALLTALLMSFIFSPWFIRRLQKKQWGQVVRHDGPHSHLAKRGTPTMGGGLILISIVVPSLLWMDLSSAFLWVPMLLVMGYGALGFLDDYLKIRHKNSGGLPAKVKLLGQILVAALAITLFQWWQGEQSLAVLYVPFLKNLSLPLGWLAIPFACLVIISSSNAVNLTDGLDGLAIGPVMIAASTFALLTYVTGHVEIARYLHYHHVPGSGELSIFALTLVGAGLGFLWYNTYPAQVFMGDVGSLPLGAALGALAVLSRHELLWVIIGGIFVFETVSVITQVVSYRLTGRRVFKMAPIHHHFELKGWPEPKVIVRFWIIAIILAMVGLLSLKLR